jgi:hypothetical protein
MLLRTEILAGFLVNNNWPPLPCFSKVLILKVDKGSFSAGRKLEAPYNKQYWKSRITMLLFELVSLIETVGYKLAEGKELREGLDSKELWKSVEK